MFADRGWAGKSGYNDQNFGLSSWFGDKVLGIIKLAGFERVLQTYLSEAVGLKGFRVRRRVRGSIGN